MSSPWAPVLVATSPARGGVTQEEVTLYAQSLQLTMAWGVSPGSAVLTYVSADQDAVITPVSAGAFLTITAGGHTFYGICKQDSGVTGSDGRTRTLEFVDTRQYLDDDVVLCAFNIEDHYTNSNGVRVRGYKHLFPEDFDGWNWTYTDGPLTAAEILNAMFEAPTVLTSWARVYHSDQANYPVYEINCLSGKKLASAIQEVSDKQGLMVGLVGGPYRLVWVRKGEGPAPTFPTNSDQRRYGVALSGNATRVLVIGDRNLYQVMNVPLIPDWARAWEEFVIFEQFAEDIYQRANNPSTGQPFKNTAGDPEQFIGRQLAAAHAREITVRQYVALRGEAYADYGRFAGRSRMDMPAALYISTLLFRAFRPDLTSFGNVFGTGVSTLNIEDRLLARVTHDAATGVMTSSANDPADGNGFAVAKGYRIGTELFRNMKPEQFNADLFKEATAIWQPVPFQLDDAGDGSRFLIFDEPVVVSNELLTEVNGHTVINSDFTLQVPQTKATLVFAAEKYSYYAGVTGRDHIENVPGLHGEYIVDGGIAEIPYIDGWYANDKAAEIAASLLGKQWYYGGGGYTVRGSNATQLSSVIDRVSFQNGPNGWMEVVDFTLERGRNAFEPERALDRAKREETLLPGQAQLQQEANLARLLAEGFKQSPKTTKALGELLSGGVEYHGPLQTVYVKNGSGVIAVGTPLRKRSLTVGSNNVANTNTLCVLPAAATSEDKIFGGVTVRQNEAAGGPVKVQTQGIALIRVRGPVNENESVGLGSGTEDYLVTGSSASVGVAHQKIADATTQLIPVRIGAGGGGGNFYRVKSIEGDFLTCVKWGGKMHSTAEDGTEEIYIARDPELRRSTYEGKTIAWNSDGDAFNATYSYESNTKRIKTVNGVAEPQVIIPYYKTGFTVIKAQTTGPTGVTDPNENQITITEDTQRAWAKLEV